MGIGVIHRFFQASEDQTVTPVGLPVLAVREDDPVNAPDRTTAEGKNIKPTADSKGRLWGRQFIVDDAGAIIRPRKENGHGSAENLRSWGYVTEVDDDGIVLLGRKAAAASRPVVLSTEDLAKLQEIIDRLGEVQASPTANTIQDRLKTIQALLTTLGGNTDNVETLLAQLIGEVDALEESVGATTDVDTADTLVGLTKAIKGAASAIRTAVEIMDDWDSNDRAKVSPIVGQDGVEAGAGPVTARTQRVVSADPVVSSALGVNSFDTSQGSPIPTNASPWLGIYEDASAYVAQAIVLKASASGGAVVRGIVRFSYKRDNSTTVIALPDVPVAVTDADLHIPVPLMNVGPLFKVDFVPDTSAPTITSAAMTTLHYRSAPPDLTRFQTQAVGPGEPVKVVRSLIEPSLVGERGLLGADREIFGAAIAHERISHISLNPTKPIANNRIDTVTGTSGGTVTQSATNAEFVLSTGSGASNTVRMESLVKTRYNPAREMYLMVPVRFSSGIANSHQRVGLYDNSDGFFLGFNGTSFGFTHRKGGLDIFTPLNVANGDPLNGTANSRFTRGGQLEAVDHMKKNIWRIRMGLLGSSLQFFDVQSPDGLWMRVHSNRFPNLQTSASIANWNLPFRAEGIKNSAGSTDLIIGVGSVDAGVVSSAFGFEPSQTKSREHPIVAIAGITASGVQYTPPTGMVLVGKTIHVVAENSDDENVLRIRVRDGIGGPLKFSCFVEEAIGGLGNVNTVGSEIGSYLEGARFNTNVYVDIASGTTPAADLIIIGYLEAA